MFGVDTVPCVRLFDSWAELPEKEPTIPAPPLTPYYLRQILVEFCGRSDRRMPTSAVTAAFNGSKGQHEVPS